MTRARSLSRLANSTVFTVSDTNRVGIGSTIPDVKLDVGGKAIIDDTTQSTTTTSGALVVSGGVGIAKSLFVGGDMSVAGTLTYEDVTNVETAGITTTGGLVVTGLGATFGSSVGIADSIYHLDDSNTAIRFPAADTFTVETSGSERIRVDSSGNVVIGATSAGSKFHVNVGTDQNIAFNSTGGNPRISAFNDAVDASVPLIVNGSDLRITTSDTERLRILANGLIGIGTDDPDNFNANADDLVIFGTGHQGLTIRSGTSHDGSIMFNDTNDTNQRGIIRYIHTDDAMAFHTNGGEALRITTAGLVGVGTVGPTHSLHVYDVTDNSAQRNDVQAYTGGITIQNQAEVFDAFAALRFNFHGDDSFYLKSRRIANNNGEFEIGQNYSSTSTDNIAIKIDNSLNVGIGSTIPGNKLSVDGDIGLYGSGTNHRNLYIYKDNVSTAWFKYRGDTNSVIIGTNAGDKLTINPSGDLNVAGITTATQLFEGTTRVATTGKAIAMAMLFG